MNILLINASHPTVKHVSAVRAWGFARSLASRGHRTVLVTGEGDPSGLGTEPVHPGLEMGVPVVVPIADPRPRTKALLRYRAARKLHTAGSIAFRSGVNTRWVRAAEQEVIRLARRMRFEAIWTTFGTFECVYLAQRLSKVLRVPWVMDVKDVFHFYVPRGLRKLTAWRFRSASAHTANSALCSDQVREWLGRDAAVIYSGVEETFFKNDSRFDPAGELRIQVIGALYTQPALETLLQGCSRWAAGLTATDQARVCIDYVGKNDDMLSAVARKLGTDLRIEYSGYIGQDELSKKCRTAFANAYVWLENSYSSKLMELAVAGRPIIAVPGELPESKALAEKYGVQLDVCSNATAVVSALEKNWTAATAAPQKGTSNARVETLRWAPRAAELEQVLQRVVQKGRC